MSEWPLILIGDVAVTVRERVAPVALGDKILRHYSIPAFDSSRIPVLEQASQIQSQKFAVHSDSVLVSMLNPRIPRVWRVLGSPSAVCSTEFSVLVSKSEHVFLTSYLHLICEERSFARRLIERATGTTGSRSRSKVEHVLSFRFGLPSQLEQRRIAAVMSAVDAQIETLEAEAKSLDLVRLVALEDAMSGLDSPGTTLGDVLDIVRGGSPRPIDDYFTDASDGLDWIKIGDVPLDGKYVTRTKQKIKPAGLSKTRYVQAGSFILSNSMSFGRPYILKIDGCIHDGWLALTDAGKNFNQDFLYYLLRSKAVQSQFDTLARGSGVRNLNTKLVATVRVPLPTMEMQGAIVARLNTVLSHVEAAHSELAALRTVRADLLTALLSQEVDVNEAVDQFVVAG